MFFFEVAQLGDEFCSMIMRFDCSRYCSFTLFRTFLLSLFRKSYEFFIYPFNILFSLCILIYSYKISSLPNNIFDDSFRVIVIISDTETVSRAIYSSRLERLHFAVKLRRKLYLQLLTTPVVISDQA